MERNVQTDGVLAQALSSRMKITNTWFSSFTVLPYFPKIIKQDLQLWRNKVVWQLHSSVLVKATVFFREKTEEKRQLLMAAGREGKNVKGEWLRDREKEMTENRQEAIPEFFPKPVLENHKLFSIFPLTIQKPYDHFVGIRILKSLWQFLLFSRGCVTASRRRMCILGPTVRVAANQYCCL